MNRFFDIYLMIRQATSQDFASIAEIYNYYILNSHSTFELDPITDDEMGTRIKKVQDTFKLPWRVLIEENQVVGYAYATQWKARKAYARTTETSVYIHKDHFGMSYGRTLYGNLIDQLKMLGYHTLIGGISLPNDASVRLHESLGFQKIGTFKEVGYKFDRWIDVGYWQLIIK